MSDGGLHRIIGERYRVVQPIGMGGLGTVVKAIDTVLQRPVAIKLIQGQVDAATRTRIVQEARVMARVRGQHVVTIYDCIIGDDDLPCLVMELVEGATLDVALRSSWPIRAG